jgi:hypothetical protein
MRARHHRLDVSRIAAAFPLWMILRTSPPVSRCGGFIKSLDDAPRALQPLWKNEIAI